MVRQIVSNQTKHRGGFARVEEDTKTKSLYLTCSGCNTEKAFGPGLAAAVAELARLHNGPIIVG